MIKLIKLSPTLFTTSIFTVLFLTACGGGGGKGGTNNTPGNSNQNNGAGQDAVIPFYLSTNNKAAVFNISWLGSGFRLLGHPSSMLVGLKVNSITAVDFSTPYYLLEYKADTFCKEGSRSYSFDSPPTPLTSDEYSGENVLLSELGTHPYPNYVIQYNGKDYFTQYSLEAKECYRGGVLFDGIVTANHTPADAKRRGAGTYN